MIMNTFKKLFAMAGHFLDLGRLDTVLTLPLLS